MYRMTIFPGRFNSLLEQKYLSDFEIHPVFINYYSDNQLLLSLSGSTWPFQGWFLIQLLCVEKNKFKRQTTWTKVSILFIIHRSLKFFEKSFFLKLNEKFTWTYQRTRLIFWSSKVLACGKVSLAIISSRQDEHQRLRNWKVRAGREREKIVREWGEASLVFVSLAW